MTFSGGKGIDFFNALPALYTKVRFVGTDVDDIVGVLVFTANGARVGNVVLLESPVGSTIGAMTGVGANVSFAPVAFCCVGAKVALLVGIAAPGSLAGGSGIIRMRGTCDGVCCG